MKRSIDEDISDLSDQVKQLAAKVEGKRRDVWDVLGVLTTFGGTIVVAGVSLYVTQRSQRFEADRNRDFQQMEAERSAHFQQMEAERAERFQSAQIESGRAQIRVAELQAVMALVPLLASKDLATRTNARQILQAVDASSKRGVGPSTQASTPASTKSVLDIYATIALSATATISDRVAATEKIGRIAGSSSTPNAIRDQATKVVTQIVASPSAPEELKSRAEQILSGVKRISAEEAVRKIESTPLSRRVTEVIVHHTGAPAKVSPDGTATVRSVVQYQVKERGWKNVSWHFAIAPDGGVWPGVPLNEKATHTNFHDADSISILLFLDGDHELPGERQKLAFVQVVKAVLMRVRGSNSSQTPILQGLRLHREFSKTNCPGKMITPAVIEGWLSGS